MFALRMLKRLPVSVLRPLVLPRRGLLPFKLAQCPIRHMPSGPTITYNNPTTGQEEAFTCDEEPLMLGLQDAYGFAQLKLGDRVCHGKYEIVRKLGWSERASIWLARDGGDYVALKVLNAATTFGTLKHPKICMERRAWWHLNLADPTHHGHNYFLRLKEDFVDESEHGIHYFFVMEVLGGDTLALQNSYPGGILPVLMVKRIVKQVLLGLSYLHDLGMSHNDIKPQNIVLASGQTSSTISKLLQTDPSVYYPTRHVPELFPDPIVTVKTQPLPNFELAPDGSNIQVKLIDFDSTCTPENYREYGEHLGDPQPVVFRAPEVILGYPWGVGVDIWSLGVLTYSFLTGRLPFQHSSEEEEIGKEHLARIAERVGEEFEEEFLQRCNRREQILGEEDSSVKALPGSESIEGGLRINDNLSEDEIVEAASFIQDCLRLDPRKRPTANELSKHIWIEKM